MDELLYNFLKAETVLYGLPVVSFVVTSNVVGGIREYRHRKLSNGLSGFSRSDDNNVGDYIFSIPGEYFGDKIYRWKHPRQDIIESPPTTPSSDSGK